LIIAGSNPVSAIAVFLGCNDTFRSPEETVEEAIDNMFTYTDMLLAEFRRVGTRTQIGLVMLVPPAASQDAFGSNYTCDQTRWQYRRNQHRVVERMQATYGDREADNIFLIPAYVNIDCVNNYPMQTEPTSARNPAQIARHANGVHPATPGYDQIADSIYAWLRYRLSQ
jgi:lysophospholipase L1-like esterase